MEQNRKRALIIGAATFIVFALLALVILLSFAMRPATAVVSKAFANNIHNSVQVDDHTIYFFTGSAFAAYDLTTYATKDLTPFYAIPLDVDKVVIGKKGALARISNYSAVDSLFSTITSKGFDTAGTFWWLFDFDTKKITLVGSAGNEATVNQALWQDDTNYVFDERQGDSSLRLMQATIGQAPTQIASLGKNAGLVWASRDTVLYTDEQQDGRQSIMHLNIADGQTTELSPQYDVNAVLATGPDQSMLFIVGDSNRKPSISEAASELEEDDAPVGQLYLYDGTAKQFTKLEDDFTGTAAWSLSGNKWVVAGSKNSNQEMLLFNEGKTVKRLNTTPNNGQEYFAVGATDKGVLVSNIYGDLFYAGQQQINGLPTAPNAVAVLGSHIFMDDFQMAYDTTFKQFNFYILSKQNSTAVDSALQYIRSKGVDPYQIRTKWYGNKSSDLTQ
jgi:hypothetical protein